jgi:hypothetical protein
MEAPPTRSSSFLPTLRRFFSNPLVGVAGSIASIIGLALAIYFFIESQRNRELLYMVHPAKAVIVKSGQLSRLAVTIDGNAITADLTAAQIAFWNQGKEPIRKEHVLHAFTLRTDPKTPIIDATLRKKSRDVVHIELDKSRIKDGELMVSWNIMERDDGGIVQLIFAGDANTNIRASAVIEGQPVIRRLDTTITESTTEGYTKRTRITWWTTTAVWAMILSFIAWLLFDVYRGRMPSRHIWIIVGLQLALATTVTFFFLEPAPPFGF